MQLVEQFGFRRAILGLACFAVLCVERGAASAADSTAQDKPAQGIKVPGTDLFIHDAYIKLNTDNPVAKSDEIAFKAVNALYDGVRAETLPNGLRVFLKPVPSSPVVTTMVAYKVGSADEDLDNTGLSHY